MTRAHWCAAIGERDVFVQSGAFGENLSTVGIAGAQVAVGDTFRLGDALIQVSQGRQPCWKLNLRFGLSDMALRVQTTGRTGWYYRVLEEGFVEAGNELLLVDHLSPEWTIERLWRVLYADMINVGELTAMSDLGHLPESWRRYATRRLATAQVEGWSSRLTGEDRRGPI